MNELIKINKNQEGMDTVNARELHEFLEITSEFRDWIKNQIKSIGFEENIDYTIMGGKNLHPIIEDKFLSSTKEYYVTVDMAKELSMLTRSEKGKEARKYFIDCEMKLVKIKENLPAMIKENQTSEILLQKTKEQYYKLLSSNRRQHHQLQRLTDSSHMLSSDMQNLGSTVKKGNKKQVIELKDMAILADMIVDRLDVRISEIIEDLNRISNE